MSFRNSITIVASPRPRVGKTLLARLLADFHPQEGRAVAAFDLNSGEHTLAQFLPERRRRQTFATSTGRWRCSTGWSPTMMRPRSSISATNRSKPFFAVAASDRLCRGGASAIDCDRDPVRRDAGPNFGRGLSQSARPLPAGDAGASAQRNAGAGAASRQISAGQRRRRWCGCRCWRRACANISTRRRFHLPMRNWPKRPGFPQRHIELQHWLRRIHLEFRELDLRILLADLSLRSGSAPEAEPERTSRVSWPDSRAEPLRQDEEARYVDHLFTSLSASLVLRPAAHDSPIARGKARF